MMAMKATLSTGDDASARIGLGQRDIDLLAEVPGADQGGDDQHGQSASMMVWLRPSMISGSASGSLILPQQLPAVQPETVAGLDQSGGTMAGSP